MIRWKYRILDEDKEFAGLTKAEAEDFLNIMGAEGWELVIIDIEQGYYYFKRPVREGF